MRELLSRLGLEQTNPGGFAGRWLGEGPAISNPSPVDGKPLPAVKTVSVQESEAIIAAAHDAFIEWRSVPAPQRGQLVRELGNALRVVKSELATLITLEMGKIRAEAEGEVQEMIDICDFAVGLSRQLYGLTMPSERPLHRLYEQWHPLGAVGVITAFNFPTAVWSWNAAIAAVCGDSMIWKPSSKTPLCAIAVTRIADSVCKAHGVNPAVFSLLIGPGSSVGQRLLEDHRVPLISATGSCQLGKQVAQTVSGRFGRVILELGGNNAVIVTPSADLDLATRAILFGAVGTAGQRCTTIRRLIVHEKIAQELIGALTAAYAGIRIGNPLDGDTLMGPLVSRDAVEDMTRALAVLREQGGKILYGGERLTGTPYPGDCYVTPCIAAADPDLPIVREETFAPLLYVHTYSDFERALAIHNGVPQGLSSAVFTRDLLEAERFLAVAGSDCGIANVNIGTSGAEIGGAFGGEKQTGGGREAGSDAWKAYMRRQTVTINYSPDLPLAQGITFPVAKKS